MLQMLMNTKFGLILSTCSQDISRNEILNQYRAVTLSNFAKHNRKQFQARSCQCRCVHKIWSDSVIRSQYIERKLTSDIIKGCNCMKFLQKKNGW